MTSRNAMARLGRALCILGLSATLLLVPRLAGAADEYPAPAFFLGGLTEQSSWDEILKKPGVKAAFPFVGFGPTFVPLSGICSGGEMLAIADPRMDTGVRVSAEELRAQVQAAAAARGYVAEPGGQLAAMTPSGASSQVATRYPVSVYKVFEQGLMREYVFLFDKLWPIPACLAK
jgi:hypothetical protein